MSKQKDDQQMAIKNIAKMYKKDELAKWALDSFNKLADVLQAVNIAMPNIDELSPIKREMINTAAGRKMQQNAKQYLWYISKIYNYTMKKSISNIDENNGDNKNE